jgi:non-heme chloroperoxidase
MSLWSTAAEQIDETNVDRLWRALTASTAPIIDDAWCGVTDLAPKLVRRAFPHRGGKSMPYVTVGQENSAAIELYYEDHGSGQPVVLIHGFPLSGASWEKQLTVLLAAGHRVITYDRRGFGRSSQPAAGYDYDTFAADLKTLLDTLDLNDIVLAGFSMGTGEVTRYIGTYGTQRVTKAVLFGPIPPFLLQTADNPEGVPGEVFEGLKRAIRADRPAYLKAFLDDFYNVDKLGGTLISDQAWQASFIVAVGASPVGTHNCVDSWLTDFRGDLPKIDVPVLVVQGVEDRILPIDATGRRLPALIKDVRFAEIEGGPHNIGWTHADQVNKLLLDFIAE